MIILSTARKTISLFLAFILTAGTITVFFSSSSSFITEVRALSAYEMMMDESKSQYLPYQKDDIKCNNFNLNTNGFNVNAIPEPLSGLLQAQAQARNSDIGTSTFGNDEKRFGSDNKDFTFKCVNNNDNERNRSPTPPPPLPEDFLDLAVATSDNVFILLGNGDGTFDAVNNLATETNPNSVTVGDFNEDTIQDLAVSSFNAVSIFLGNGDGTFGMANNFPTLGLSSRSIAVGDFNDDTIADLVTSNQDTDDVSILLGNGDGTFDTPNNISVGNNPVSVAVGNFN